MARLTLLVLFVCLSIMDSRSESLPKPKPKPKPGEEGLQSDDFNQPLFESVMDRSSTDYANNKTCKVKWGYCKHSFQYGEKALDDCPAYKLNKASRCPIQNYQCTNRAPFGPNQYGGHGWCYYDYEGKTHWDWCGSGCNKCSWRCYDCQPPSWLEILVSKLPNPKCRQWCSQGGYCGDTPDHKKYGTDCTGCINEDFSVTSACPSSCKCASGQRKLDKNSNCNHWCSQYGACGETNAHKQNGVDCRGCAVTLACPSSCKCASGQRKVDKNSNCNHWCSQYGACGETNAHIQNGVDCRGCADFSVPSACPSSCKCASGQQKVDKNSNCNHWCSQYGVCGETDAHKQNGVDCRGCAD